MGQFKVDKQGVELEIQAVDSGFLTSKYNEGIDWDKLHAIATGFHQDDSKAEFSSSPHKSLGDMEKELTNEFLEGMEYLKEYYLPILQGCTPFFQDFASGHIHTSVKDMSESTWMDLRRKLFNIQPIIALLSQNSPLCLSYMGADARLALSTWSRFTDFDSVSDDHWMSLAWGQEGQTIEVRIPSAGPLQQILGIAALIRVVLEDDCAVYALPEVKANWDNVITYGSSSLCKITFPKTINYSGVRMGYVHVKTTDLFKIFLEDNVELIERTLETLSSRNNREVREFYDFITRGHTLSDSIYEQYKKESKKQNIMKTLDSLSFNTYKNSSIFDYLSSNPERMMPIIEKCYTIDDLREIVNKLSEPMVKDRIPTYSEDFFEIITGPHGVFKDMNIRDILVTISRGSSVDPASVPANTLKVLIDIKVVRMGSSEINHRPILLPGENFGIVVQLCKEAGLF